MEFASKQFIGSELSEVIEVTVKLTGGVTSSPIIVTVTLSEMSAGGKCTTTTYIVNYNCLSLPVKFCHKRS